MLRGKERRLFSVQAWTKFTLKNSEKFAHVVGGAANHQTRGFARSQGPNRISCLERGRVYVIAGSAGVSLEDASVSA